MNFYTSLSSAPTSTTSRNRCAATSWRGCPPEGNLAWRTPRRKCGTPQTQQHSLRRGAQTKRKWGRSSARYERATERRRLNAPSHKVLPRAAALAYRVSALPVPPRPATAKICNIPSWPTSYFARPHSQRPHSTTLESTDFMTNHAIPSSTNLLMLLEPTI